MQRQGEEQHAAKDLSEMLQTHFKSLPPKEISDVCGATGELGTAGILFPNRGVLTEVMNRDNKAKP
jgi:hypothetical protein